MTGVYRPRHPERTVLYRVMFHHFERFLTEYESRFEPEGKVGYRHGRNGSELERMDYLEFIARVVSHIPNKGQVMVRYYGLYANAHRGKVRKASPASSPLRIVEEELRRIPSKGWAEMIRKVYEVDPMTCPRCGGALPGSRAEVRPDIMASYLSVSVRLSASALFPALPAVLDISRGPV